MKPQWEKRLDLTIVIYQYLLLRPTKQETLIIALDQFNLENEAIVILEYLFENEKIIEQEIKPLLNKTWTWERMNYFDRAIILEAICENRVYDTPKAIIIDQALITARNYNIDDSYKYINALLDKLIVCKNTL